MRAYRAILAVHVHRLLQYRTAAAAGFATQLFWGLILTMTLEAFYRSTSRPQPMEEQQAISYIWLGQAFLLLVPFGVEPDIAALIRTGGVAYEMLRPLDLFSTWYVRCLAGRVAPIALRCLPMLLVAGLLFGLDAPASPASAALWLAATAGALLLSAAYWALVTITLLWSISGEGLARLLPAINWIFCGIVIPLPFLPDWSQRVVLLLPFRGMLDTPLRLYVGHIAPPDAWAAIGHQLAWTAALFLLGRWLVGRRLARLVVQGG